MPTLQQLAGIMPNILDTGISVELISSPGIGKSDFVEQLVASRTETTGIKWGMSQAFLATYTPPDLIGYQFKGERMWRSPHTGEMEPVAVTDPSMPLWMISSEGRPLYEYERGILFLDEFGQGEADVKRAAAQLLLKREIGPWRLPPGWSVMAASNRANDRSGVTKSFDFVINRRVEYHITPDLLSWDAWAISRGIDPLFVAFAHQHPEIVFSGSVPKQQGPWCTPRSLVMAHDLLVAISGGAGQPIRMDDLGAETMRGTIGDAATAQLKSFIDVSMQLPSLDDIVDDPTKCALPTRADGQMLVVFQLAHVAHKDIMRPVGTYINRLGASFETMFIKRLIGRSPTFAMDPVIDKMVTRNAHLIHAVA
jgi:hypothetical protein